MRQADTSHSFLKGSEIPVTTNFVASAVSMTALGIMALLCLMFIWKLRQARHSLAQNQEYLGLTPRSSQVAVWTLEIAGNTTTADDNTSFLFVRPLGQFPQIVEGNRGTAPPRRSRACAGGDRSAVEKGRDYNTEFRVGGQKALFVI
jgi:hypothetical protein